ncbi:GGDEF domain-containing protein [Psychromonas marina]|nr:GGDEF domain-containing protein [Psychromonas marina]
MKSKKFTDEVNLKITKQLYLHSPFAIFSTIFNTIVVVIVFYNRTSHDVLFSWAILSISYLIFRLFFARYVIKTKITLSNLKKRLDQFTLTICISGIIFGSAGVLFLSADSPAYNSFIFFLMGGMFAGSMGAYAINQRVFYVFSAPIILPVLFYSFILGGTINTAMSLMGVVFIMMMVGVVRRMNMTIIDAYTLSIENKILAEKTRNLNEKLKFSNANLKSLSYKDTLTNISNRRFLTEMPTPEIERFGYSLQRSIGDHQRNTNNKDANLVYGVFIIDIDLFKQVNDTWGHKCGDLMIIQFVNVIQSLIRKEDVLCRWGGEEFVVILKRTDPDYIHLFAKKLMNSIRATPFILSDSVTINKTCSVGYTTFPFFDNLPSALSLDQTIELADQALYHAKEHGRNKAVSAEYNIAQGEIINLDDSIAMMKDITQALANKKILHTERC